MALCNWTLCFTCQTPATHAFTSLIDISLSPSGTLWGEELSSSHNTVVRTSSFPPSSWQVLYSSSSQGYRVFILMDEFYKKRRIQNKSIRKTHISGGFQRSQAQAAYYFSIWGHLGHVFFQQETLCTCAEHLCLEKMGQVSGF